MTYVSSLGIRGAVRALGHRRDTSTIPTRHCDCVDAGFAKGLATCRQLLQTPRVSLEKHKGGLILLTQSSAAYAATLCAGSRH